MEFKIANRICEPGTKTLGMLNCGTYFPNAPKDYIRAVAEVPFTVIRGVENGPTLCIAGGMDPTEYAGIAAVIKLSMEINPKTLRGTLILIHVANILGFWERKYVTSLDQKRLTSEFPGDAGGTITQSIAYHLFHECISKSNYYIELHGSDSPESMAPYSAFYRVGNEAVDAQSEALAKALGHKYVGAREELLGEELKSGPRVASQNGIPSVISELGEGDRLLDDEVNAQFEAACNVMRHLGMLNGEPKITRDQVVTPQTLITVNHNGLFYADAEVGDVLEKDAVIGTVRDLFGRELETVRAPAKGVVLCLIHNPVVQVGQPLVLIYGLL
jgi:predicted deacylase